MNNALTVSNMMNKIADQGLLFNVTTSPVSTEFGVIEGKKAIINADTHEALGVVSNRYKVVPNSEIFEGFAKSIAASNLDATDMSINVATTPKRNRSIVDFVFPAERFSVEGDRSSTALSITALNSYDGSTRFVAKAGGLRMKCMNGQILGNVAGSYSATHTQSLNVDDGAQRVIRMIQDFQNSKAYFGRMMQSSVSLGKVEHVLMNFLNLDINDDASRSNKRFLRLMETFSLYRFEMGQNVYALYNCLTDYVSHCSARNADTAATNQMTNRRRLEKTLASEPIFI